MGSQNKVKPDPALKNYWNENSRFADLFNQALFNGEEVITPDSLTPQDTDESAIIREKEFIGTISRSRDVIKQHADGTALVLVAIEAQMLTHYAMPARAMLYDSLNYTKQCKAAENSHQAARDLKTPAEFLSGMTKADRIRPVISLVIYYGEDDWDGSVMLSEMMSIPKQFLPYFNDYKINLIDVKHAAKLGFKNRQNLEMFKCFEDYYEYKKSGTVNEFKKSFTQREVDWEVAAVIGAVTGMPKLIEGVQKNKGGKVDMWTAFEELQKESEAKGETRGEAKGAIKGAVIAYRECEVPDTVIIRKLQDNFELSYEKAKEYLVMDTDK